MEISTDFALLPVNKPKGLTSTEVLNLLKEKFKLPKLGHTGTLDPFAEGLLIVLLGRATRLTEYYQRLPKTYIATALLGLETDTYDITGKVVKEYKGSFPSKEELKEVLKTFEGEIEQLPPPFSAKKIKGKRAYKLARKGLKVELKPIRVKISDLELLEYKPPEFTIKATVSGGTYIRSLIKDIGEKLKTGATTKSLIRTAIGTLTLERAVDLDKLLKGSNLESYLLPPWIGLPFSHLEVEEKIARRLKNGQMVEFPKHLRGETVLIFSNGRFVGIGKNFKGKLKPEKIFL